VTSRSPKAPGRARVMICAKVTPETKAALAAQGHPSSLAAQILEQWAASVGAILAELAQLEHHPEDA
jgi:hypothetical protein